LEFLIEIKLTIMKTIKLVLPVISSVFIVSCEPVYVPVYVPVEQKTAQPKPAARPKPAPKPAETAESFRAVERPTTYSN